MANYRTLALGLSTTGCDQPYHSLQLAFRDPFENTTEFLDAPGFCRSGSQIRWKTDNEEIIAVPALIVIDGRLG